MQPVLNIIVAAALILPFSIAGRDAPSTTQSATEIPKSESQQPTPAVNGKSSGFATEKTQKKPHKTATETSATGSTGGKAISTHPKAVSTGGEAPKKTVVRQGGVAEPSAQIVTDMDLAEAARRREDSERLLNLADENLKRLVERALTEQQQETVSQIDRYITVARSALKEGDISRGHTLALKANLLAVDLVKH
jgi:hypothetical protein